MPIKAAFIFLGFCVIIIGGPTPAWVLGHIVRGQACCLWGEYLAAGLRAVPFGISLGIIFALVVSGYEELLRAIKERER